MKETVETTCINMVDEFSMPLEKHIGRKLNQLTVYHSEEPESSRKEHPHTSKHLVLLFDSTWVLTGWYS